MRYCPPKKQVYLPYLYASPYRFYLNRNCYLPPCCCLNLFQNMQDQGCCDTIINNYYHPNVLQYPSMFFIPELPNNIQLFLKINKWNNSVTYSKIFNLSLIEKTYTSNSAIGYRYINYSSELCNQAISGTEVPTDILFNILYNPATFVETCHIGWSEEFGALREQDWKKSITIIIVIEFYLSIFAFQGSNENCVVPFIAKPILYLSILPFSHHETYLVPINRYLCPSMCTFRDLPIIQVYDVYSYDLSCCQILYFLSKYCDISLYHLIRPILPFSIGYYNFCLPVPYSLVTDFIINQNNIYIKYKPVMPDFSLNCWKEASHSNSSIYYEIEVIA